MADSREFQKLVESINEDRERNRKLNEGVGELVDIQKKIFKKQEEQAKRADRAEKEAERLRKLEEARNQELSKSTKTGAVAGGAGGSGALFAKLAALLLVADKIIEGFFNEVDPNLGMIPAIKVRDVTYIISAKGETLARWVDLMSTI